MGMWVAVNFFRHPTTCVSPTDSCKPVEVVFHVAVPQQTHHNTSSPDPASFVTYSFLGDTNRLWMKIAESVPFLFFFFFVTFYFHIYGRFPSARKFFGYIFSVKFHNNLLWWVLFFSSLIQWWNQGFERLASSPTGTQLVEKLTLDVRSFHLGSQRFSLLILKSCLSCPLSKFRNCKTLNTWFQANFTRCLWDISKDEVPLQYAQCIKASGPIG